MRRDTATPRRHTRAMDVNGELVITFNVTRGPAFRVARVDISGNTALPVVDVRIGPPAS